jgi:MoaA/NifB/PqqE/SkfB family radical SAM enzyme
LSRAGIAETLRRAQSRATHRLASLPTLVLMPHSACNCRCVMCDIWKANASAVSLDAETIERLMPDIDSLQVRAVTLTGGEALLHRNLWTLCELLKARGIHIYLLSTGLLLKRWASEIAKWTDEVIVSIDGPPEAHDEIRQVTGAYRRMAEGIAAIRAVRPSFRVTGRSVVQDRNAGILLATAESAREIGLDSISFLPVDTTSDAFNRPDGWDEARSADVRVAPERLDALQGAMGALLAWPGRPGFVVESPARLRWIVDHARASVGQGRHVAPRCDAPWVSAVVEADGAVRPCFFQPAYGQLDGGGLREVVNSPGAIAFRRSLRVAEDPICQRCVCSLHLGLSRNPM